MKMEMKIQYSIQIRKPLNYMTNDSLIDARSVTAKKDNLPTDQTFLTLNS